jgi:Cu+-exporting ATPase
LSRKIAQTFVQYNQGKPVSDFEEIAGKGIQGVVEGSFYQCGSAAFTGANVAESPSLHAKVYVSIDGITAGHFDIVSGFRPGLSALLNSVKLRLQEVWLLSGDHPGEKAALQAIFPDWTAMAFEQKPEQKMQQVQQLSHKNLRPIMFGDGLNDAAALKVAHVGVAITDDTLTFSPSCEVIVDGKNLQLFPKVLDFSQGTMRTIRLSFAVSLIYNCVGLSFALSGTLSPLIAAILMPISSVTMMLVAAGGTWWYGQRLLLNT